MKKLINGVELEIGPNIHLENANLEYVDLQGANLEGACLYKANLYKANLENANLHGVNLEYANLYRANLKGANLRDADLRGANLESACLYHTNLQWADLYGADLYGTNLEDANIQYANMEHAKNILEHVFHTTNILPEGDIIGYKKLRNGSICKLLIPSTAKRSNATGRKCRAEYAIVLEGEGFSEHDAHFYYRKGETVKPTGLFHEDRWSECSTGIHFYITKYEAERH